MPKDTTIQVRAPRPQKERFRRCAEIERLSLSEWLRRLAIVRAAELLPDASDDAR